MAVQKFIHPQKRWSGSGGPAAAGASSKQQVGFSGNGGKVKRATALASVGTVATSAQVQLLFCRCDSWHPLMVPKIRSTPLHRSKQAEAVRQTRTWPNAFLLRVPFRHPPQPGRRKNRQPKLACFANAGSFGPTRQCHP